MLKLILFLFALQWLRQSVLDYYYAAKYEFRWEPTTEISEEFCTQSEPQKCINCNHPILFDQPQPPEPPKLSWEEKLQISILTAMDYFGGAVRIVLLGIMNYCLLKDIFLNLIYK